MSALDRLASVCTTTVILASAVPAAGAEAPAPEADESRIEVLRVFASPLRPRSEEVAQPTRVLAGESLDRSVAPTIGETVGGEPGVSSSYFGPAVGRPVIRGLGGARVRVLADGIGTLDVSTTSADHAVGIEPFLAEQVEILKGPASVLYGSGAIGGVVNVVSGRIPERRAERGVSGRGELRIGDVADERTGALRLDGGGGALAWHVDGLVRETDDHEIPGAVASEALRRVEPGASALGDERLPGSDLETAALAGGGAWIGERGRLGAAVSRYTTEYGLPATPGARIDLRQTRLDVHAELETPVAGFERLRLRAALNDYEHAEIEPSGEIGTEFDNEAFEARIEAMHAPVLGFGGALGLQLEAKDFAAIGEEAFVVPTERRAAALFAYERARSGDVSLELGARVEGVRLDPDGGGAESFLAGGASAGVVWEPAETLSLALQADLSRRAPSSEELFSEGPHLATRSFEIGDPDADVERARNVSLTLRAGRGRLDGEVSVFRTAFSDFLFLAATGAVADGLPVRRWSQDEAVLRGLEYELTATLVEGAHGSLDLRAFGDLVRGRLDDAAPGGSDALPRITPARFGVALEGSRERLSGQLTLTYVTRQDENASFELETPAYAMLDAYVGWHLDAGRTHTELFVKGGNLLDQNARMHTSFVKDRAPLPGRSLAAGIRVSF